MGEMSLTSGWIASSSFRRKDIQRRMEIDAFQVCSLCIIRNQPCLHISWLFNESGRPDLTQKMGESYFR